MPRPFSELKKRMDPDHRARAEARARDMMAEMLLSEIRKQTGLTQQDLADSLGIRQPTLSQLETASDMQITTLRRLIHALGGELELIAHLPQGDVRLTQFKNSDQPTI